LECNGAIVRKADYADLYSVIKDTYTNVLSGDHFRLPDLRGEFVRGWDNGRNINPGRVFGSNEDGMFESHAHEQTGNSLSNSGASDIYFDTGDGSQSPNINSSGGGVTISNTGGAETRPRNVALLPCIKALKTVTGPTSVANSYIKAFGSVKYQNGDTSGSDHSTGGGSQATEMTAFSFHNVVSVTWMERGIYRITLTNAMPNINYTVVSQIAPANNFTFASNSDENFMDYSSPDYYHNGNEGILLTFNKTTSTFDIVCWSPDGNKKENLNGFDFLVLSV
jgi:microcystin-dependent protein